MFGEDADVDQAIVLVLLVGGARLRQRVLGFAHCSLNVTVEPVAGNRVQFLCWSRQL